MAVVCETCATSNRDAAQYCRGCSGKLPAFYAVPGRATAPASLTGALAYDRFETPERGRTAGTAGTESGLTAPRIRVTATGLWLTAGLLLALVLATGLMWYLGQSAAAQARAGVTPTALPQALPAAAPSQRSERDAAALAAADAAMALMSKPPENSVPDKPLVSSTPPDRTTAVRPPRSSAGRITVGDPTLHCTELNFFARAICINNVCADPAVAGHPQCKSARLQRQRDEARRNLPN